MPGERGTFDLYVPESATASTPVVVFFYGGGWDGGAKSIYPFVGQSLASEGFIVAIPDYRIYPEVRFPGFVEDGARAVAAVEGLVRKGGGGVPAGRHPVFLMGHSAGAQIAALLAYDGRYLAKAGASNASLAGFIGLSGPYDFLPLKEERYKRIFPPALRDASQPVRFVSAGDPRPSWPMASRTRPSTRRTRVRSPRACAKPAFPSRRISIPTSTMSVR